MIPAGTFLKVSVGGDHACAIKTDNSVVCWVTTRADRRRRLPAHSKTSRPATRTRAPIRMVDGSVVCWGDNNSVSQRSR